MIRRNSHMTFGYVSADERRELDVAIGYDADEWWVDHVRKVRLFDKDGNFLFSRELRKDSAWEKLYRRWFCLRVEDRAKHLEPKYHWHGRSMVWHHEGDRIDELFWSDIASIESDRHECEMEARYYGV